MQDYEKLGQFYLGKEYDMRQQKVSDDLVLYDAKDLTTHAVCVGMTGSGKTGLCLSLLEEAALDGIPAIAIDPKGDLGNLLLTFPSLKGEDFAPWIDPEEAARNGMNSVDYASTVADRWRDGLADWGQTRERIEAFRKSADCGIYTPGSNAGLPLTVLQSFAAPAAALMEDSDAFRERIVSAVSGLLALLGVEADPIRSREHILVSNIFDHAWRNGRNLELGALIREIQSPPFDKIGFMDLETFYPSKDRFELAMQLNNLLASPGFAGWLQGEPLNIQRLYYTDTGKPRLSIISIAHLSETERMFFVTMLLNELVSWMRTQPGTSSLRCLLYMDEVFGYFPPTANPPSKTPMLTLMKQARAYGLGVVLATQNPVDLDYKGLSNAGTWFLGRLQTQRDKERVLDGLEGASASAGSNFDRSRTEAILSGLGTRVFLMNNVHDDGPITFHTRWVLSYLRGPLTRAHIQTLMRERKQLTQSQTESKPIASRKADAHQRPVFPPGITESFLPVRKRLTGKLVYRPALFGRGKLHYSQSRDKIDSWRDVALMLICSENPAAQPWEDATELPEIPDLESNPFGQAAYGEVASDLQQPKLFKAWSTGLKNFLYQNHGLELYKCKDLKETSKPEEAEGDFRARLKHQVNELRDIKLEKLRKKYATKFDSIKNRIRTAEQRVDREKSQVKSARFKSVISFGSTLLGAIMGRKVASRTNVTRAASSMRTAGRVSSQKEDVERAEESLEALHVKFEELENEFEAETEELKDQLDVASIELDTVSIRPRKSDLVVSHVCLLWVPWQTDATGISEPLYGE